MKLSNLEKLEIKDTEKKLIEDEKGVTLSICDVVEKRQSAIYEVMNYRQVKKTKGIGFRNEDIKTFFLGALGKACEVQFLINNNKCKLGVDFKGNYIRYVPLENLHHINNFLNEVNKQ